MADSLTLNRFGEFILSPGIAADIREAMWSRHPEIAAAFVVNPAVSESQRRFLNATKGHDWVKEHGFDNEGKLPEKKTENEHGQGDECQCGGECDECKAKMAVNCGGKGSGRPGPCPKHSSQAHVVARAHAAAAAHALASAATAHSRSGTQKSEDRLKNAHDEYTSKLKESLQADAEKRKQGHLTGAEKPKKAAPRKVGKSPSDVMKGADRVTKGKNKSEGVPSPKSEAPRTGETSAASDKALKSKFAATDRVHDDFVGKVVGQHLADHGWTDSKGNEVYQPLLERARTGKTHPGDVALAKHIHEKVREKVTDPDEQTQDWLAHKLPIMADAHAATAEGRGITQSHEFVRYAKHPKQAQNAKRSIMNQAEKLLMWRQLGDQLGLNQFQITPPQPQPAAGQGPDRSPAGQFASSGGGSSSPAQPPPQVPAPPAAPAKPKTAEDEAAERGESEEELKGDTRTSSADKQGGVIKPTKNAQSTVNELMSFTPTPKMTVSNPKMSVSNPVMSTTPQVMTPQPPRQMTVNEDECPKCGGPLDEDGDCEDCGHHVANSNPEGHNQFSGSASSLARQSEKGKQLKTTPFQSSATAYRLSQKTDDASPHALDAHLAAHAGEHKAAAALHRQAQTHHEAKASEWFSEDHEAHAAAASHHQAAASLHDAHALMQQLKAVKNAERQTTTNAGVHQPRHGDSGKWLHHGAGTGKGEVHAAAEQHNFARLVETGKPGVEADEMDDHDPDAIAEGDEDMREDGATQNQTSFIDEEHEMSMTSNDFGPAFQGAKDAGYPPEQAAAMAAKSSGSSSAAESVSKQATKSGTKGAHKEAAKAHKAAEKGHREKADAAREEGDRGKAKQHDIMAEHHKDAATKHRNFSPTGNRLMTVEQAKRLLTANCSCETDRVAMNALSAPVAIQLAQRLVTNAPDEEEEEGEGEEEMEGDEDMEANAGEDVHSFDGKKPTKAGELQVGGKGEKGEYMTGNRSTIAWLRRMKAPSSVINTVVNSERKETAERKAKVGRLVENIQHDAVRNRIGNKLMQGKSLTLDEATILANSSARQLVAVRNGEEETTYLGAGGGQFVDNSAPTDDILDCPVLNFKEIAVEQRQQRA